MAILAVAWRGSVLNMTMPASSSIGVAVAVIVPIGLCRGHSVIVASTTTLSASDRADGEAVCRIY